MLLSGALLHCILVHFWFALDNSANMSTLYKLFDKYITKNANVLDIGFGSCRDLLYLDNLGCNVYGIDETKKFVENAKEIFQTKESNFYQGSLPNLINNNSFNKKFDAIICIAVWMHLDYAEYEESIRNIAKLLSTNATLIISYSKGTRGINDDRNFIEINEGLLFRLLKKHNLKLIYKTYNEDSLSRNELVWETIVLKYIDEN